MAKRLAGSELNHENWDQEEEAESSGVFQKASVLGLELLSFHILNSNRVNVRIDFGYYGKDLFDIVQV